MQMRERVKLGEYSRRAGGASLQVQVQLNCGVRACLNVKAGWLSAVGGIISPIMLVQSSSYADSAV